MARTIYYPDGSYDALFSSVHDTDEKAAELERILRARLGHDAAALFHEIIQEYRDEIDTLTEEIDTLTEELEEKQKLFFTK